MPDDDDPSDPHHPSEDLPRKAAGRVVEVIGKAMEGDGAGAMAAGLGAGVDVLAAPDKWRQSRLSG